MSEQDNTLNQPGEATPLSQAVSETIPQPAVNKTFAYTDEHTPQNTPMKEFVEPQTESKQSGLDEEVREKGFTTAFLGNTKKENLEAQELVGRWITVRTARDLHNADQVQTSFLKAAENDWKQFVETKYPGKSPADMERKAISLYRFLEGIQDHLMLRTRMMSEDKISNVSRRCDKLEVPDIMGRIPGSSVTGFSISEVMARAALRATNSPYHYDVMLRNSFVKLVFVRPNKLELADLINDINRTVRGYVRQVGGNSLQLASIAGMKVVWNWLAPRIISSSIDRMMDFRDLAQVIRITDFRTLCSAILASVSDEGVNMDLRCFNLNCDHYTLDLIDPTKLIQVRHSVQTPEEAAILGNISNGRKVYSVDEVLALIDQSTYGLESNDVYNEAQNIKLTIAPPSMADAFVTFDFFVGQVDPKLQEIRAKVIDAKELEEQITIILNGLGSAEFIQWVSTFTILPPGGVDEPPVVLRRSESNPDEFNKGLMDALQTDPVLNKNLTHFIYNKVLYMTRTFSGIRNRVCPKCGKNSTDGNEPEHKLGYTPIDPFMLFFTHTQLMLMDLAVARQKETTEALS